jgi:chromosome segregation ATPase
MLGSGEAKSSPPVRQQVVDPARRASQQTQSPRRPDSLEDRIEQGTGASEITSADSPSNLPPLAKDWTAVRDAIEATAKEFVSSAEDHRRSVESRGGHLMGLVTTLIREVDERRAQAHSACVQVDEMQKEIHDLRQTNRLFSKAMVESRERETRWRAECALASQRVSDAEHRAQVEVNDVKQELEEQASMLKAVQVQQSADWTEHEKIRDERDQLAERNAELEEECAEINAGAEELMAKYNSMQRELASLQASIVRLEAKARVSLFRASLKEN